ncbi:MAG: LptF/LptG family permease, partial [Armatimonadota bacterium]
ALIGVPLSQRFARSGSFAGILVAIVLVFLYNGVMSWTKALSLGGALHPLVAAHLQNVLFGGLGIYLLHRAQ